MRHTDPVPVAAVVVLAVFVGAFVLTRITGVVTRWTVRRVADRSLVHPSSWWRTRAHRVDGESTEITESTEIINCEWVDSGQN